MKQWEASWITKFWSHPRSRAIVSRGLLHFNAVTAFHNPKGLYFLSFAAVNWLDVFYSQLVQALQIIHTKKSGTSFKEIPLLKTCGEQSYFLMNFFETGPFWVFNCNQ